jgi:group II intron reverse transcriptase/maturase
MYVERWLKAGVEQEDGSIVARTQGTPQGGVISPLLSNIYLHHAFDMWISTVFNGCPFERYADDIVIHCSVKAEAERVLQALGERLSSYGLTLHPEKTKIVYCKDHRRKGTHENESFTFLGFSYQPRMKKGKTGNDGCFLSFSPAISNEAKTHIRTSVRKIISPRCTTVRIEDYASSLNNKIRGWINYYCRIERWEISHVFSYINHLLMKWVRNTYRIRGLDRAWQKLKEIQKGKPKLFVHWAYGIRT